MGMAGPAAPRRPLRRRRRLHGGRLQTLGRQLGGRRRAARPRDGPSSPTRPKSTASGTTAHFRGRTAIHLCEPSPQRTPVLFQAGASGRGRAFAAQHAECVFIAGPSKPRAEGLRRRHAPAGRGGRARPAQNYDLQPCMTVIVGETDADAQAKLAGIPAIRQSYDGALVFMSGWSGIDFGQYAPTDLVKKVETNAIISVVENLAGGRQVLDDRGAGEMGRHWRAGAGFRRARPRPVADILQELGRGDRCRRIQPRLCRHARDIRGRRRSAGSRIAAARGLSARVQAGHAARKAVRRRPTSAGEYPAAAYRDLAAVKRREAESGRSPKTLKPARPERAYVQTDPRAARRLAIVPGDQGAYRPSSKWGAGKSAR